MYHILGDDYLKKENLVDDKDFLNDASQFLIEREGKTAEELRDPEEVYDAFMEHFRYQNVNEATAIRDMMYAQNGTDEQKIRMGRLMDAFDRMDSDLGFTAAQDYLGGVFTAPSTYAGLFSFGAGKAGALAAQQGLKIGIRNTIQSAVKGRVAKGTAAALKGQGMRNASKTVAGMEAIKGGAIRAGIGGATVDVAGGAGTTAAQEETRIASGLKEDMDLGLVATSAALSAVPGGAIGALSGAKKAVTAFDAEKIAMKSAKLTREQIEEAHKIHTSKVFKSRKKTKTGKTLGATAKDITKKLSLKETIPELLEEGGEVKRGLSESESLLVGVDEKLVQNIAAAGARIIKDIEPKKVIDPDTGKVKEERISSLLARALSREEGTVNQAQLANILKQHNLTNQQFAALFAADISQHAKEMQALGQLSKASKKATLETLDQVDKALLEYGMEVTSLSRVKLEEASKGTLKFPEKAAQTFYDFNKARIGFMTVQFATTARNTTTGYLRNYVYALDNLGAGVVNIVQGGAKRKATDADMRKAGERAVLMGKAQLRTGYQSLFMNDMVAGFTTVEAAALERLMRDPAFGASDIGMSIFRDMGDVADKTVTKRGITGKETGIMGLARKMNYLNTLSDNMFKRAIFAREVNKQLLASGRKELGGLSPDQKLSDVLSLPFGQREQLGISKVLGEGKFSSIHEFSPDIIKNAAEEALDFTYQTGKYKGKAGAFNKGAAYFIDIMSTPLGSVFVPFPRYLVNQFRFAWEHAPVIGSLNVGNILGRRTSKEFEVVMDAEALGKQFGGLMTLGTFIGLRTQFGDEKTGPFEYIDPTSNSTFNAKASIGPFSTYALMADFLYRINPDIPGFGKLHDNENVSIERPIRTQDFVEALGGGQYRGTGLGLVDEIFRIVADGTGEDGYVLQSAKLSAAKILGNYFNQYTVGAGVIKDVVATLDPDFRKIPNNTDVSFWGYFMKQATRSLPQVTDSDAEGLFGYTGIGGERSKLESPTRSSGISIGNPLLRQITGLSENQEKTFVEEELARLQFDYAELSPRRIKGDPEFSNVSRGLMGRYMETAIASFISSPEYRNKPNDAEKRALLKEQISIYKTEARNRVLNLDQYVMTSKDFERATRNKFFNLSSSKRRRIALRYEAEFRQSLSETEDYGRALALAENMGLL